ncbi:glycosyltransferase family 4 protein [Desulfobacula sp.]|uniref:glycosyltransferase family 4 protein n=1 Tax=Desulfobacula sp. TaxID=2593537 RepID=UPI0025BA0785|nr:glycosyltransferase family 4 protein [Desulfobacula sp.]MBC2704225.1 glycosyltransferase family 4 protein [Desulfobacula sp.]
MLKILFVSSGNSKNFDIAPFIKSQGDSLIKAGVDVIYFPLYGKGLSGYLKSAYRIRKFLKKNRVHIIHTHYTISGWSAVLAFPKQPIILSLMGTDAQGQYNGANKIKFKSRYLILLTYLIQPFVDAVICKSKRMENSVFLKKKSSVVPNGIMLDKIKYSEDGFKGKLGLNPDKKHILFLGNKKSKTKNYKLLKEAVGLIKSDNISVVAPYPISHDEVVKYLNSVDVLVVPSLMEGSPNVVKEAMACNCPVVATNVGDVAWLFGDEPGYYLTGFDPADVAEKIEFVLDYANTNERTKGRQRIIALGLDANTIAKRLISVYQAVVQ